VPSHAHRRHPFAIVDFVQNCLAFPAQRSDGCHDREERGTKEIQNVLYHRQRKQHHGVRHPWGSRRCFSTPFDSFATQNELGNWQRLGQRNDWSQSGTACPAPRRSRSSRTGRRPLLGSGRVSNLGEAANPEAAPAKPKADKKAKGVVLAAKGASAKGKGKKATAAKRAPKAKKAAKAKDATGPREGSKTELVIGLLKRKNGATLTEVMEKTQWLSHTTRAFVSATLGKKLGLAVESFKSDKGERTCRINP
jgi:hypothetical protein